ncbi:MAG: hypothetical protein ACTSPB_13685 [Candidatus Thorarchaeota archaeon]
MEESYEYRIHRKFIDEFGEDGIIMSFFEEVGELMTAISHRKRGRISVNDVISEIVDVKIALDSLVVLYDTSMQFNVLPTSHKIYKKKFDRLVSRVEE